jgi:hypothetical protein
VTGARFEDEAMLREALEEVADADPGDRIDEPWGSEALAAATQVATEGPDALRPLALRALDRVLAGGALLDLVDDTGAWRSGVEALRRRLA